MDTLTKLLVCLLGASRDESEAAARVHLKALRESDPAAAAQFTKAWELAQQICPNAPTFVGTCQREGKMAKVYSVRGMSALALSSHHLPHPSIWLRIPHDLKGEGKPFTDATWMHDDASIRLTDDLAALYVHEDGTCILDHSPQVLGLEVSKENDAPGEG